MASNSEAEDWSTARKGISLLLNNKPEEAEDLFNQYPTSFHIKSARTFLVFINALMTFEDDKLQRALQILRDVERECADDAGWIRSMKNRVFGQNDSEQSDFVRKLDRQVVLADAQVFAAVLTLLQQELTGYVRGGWMLRKAWRVYQCAYNQILLLHRRTYGDGPSGFVSLCGSARESRLTTPSTPSRPDNWSVPPRNGSFTAPVTPSEETPPSTSGLRNSVSMIFSMTGITSAEQHVPFVEPSEVTRLMSAVSFGYGIFQLSVSLLPPSLLRVIHFLGFEGDRQAGIAALMYSRSSQDMRAPLATLALLWYHTIVRPFFALDGSNVIAGVAAAKELMAERQPEFDDSALFLFFQGRIERLESNVSGALGAYEKAVERSKQREVKLLCLHEVCWCHLIKLDYKDAYDCLIKLQQESRWSKSFYAYLAAVNCGAQGNVEDLRSTNEKLKALVSSSNSTSRETQLAQFISRRAGKLMEKDTGRAYADSYYKLLCFELLYLWNAMPSCSVRSLRDIITECKNCQSEEPMVGLSDLVEGAARSYLGDADDSLRCYRNCIKRRIPSKDMQDQHVSAFALYELGSALCNGNNVEEGRCILQRACSQYRDYDFENRLVVRIHATLKKVS